MLKIKDNIDLKELENFGFVKAKKNNGFTMEINRWADYIYDEDFYIKNRQVVIESEWYGSSLDRLADTLFNLIQAGLVEKVVEDE